MTPRALILAAGIASRLQPLTNHTPKALLEFRGKTMLEHVLNQLANNGVKDIIINIHHLADQIRDFVQAKNSFGLNIEFSDERDQLMDTGGGIIKAGWFLDKSNPFIVHNIDIFTDIDLRAMLEYHLQKKPLATLAVTKRDSSRNLLFDNEACLKGWKNRLTGESILLSKETDLTEYAFSGIHIIDPALLNLFPPGKIFSMTTGYLELAASHKIMAFDHSGDEWIDMARPDNFPGLSK